MIGFRRVTQAQLWSGLSSLFKHSSAFKANSFTHQKSQQFHTLHSTMTQTMNQQRNNVMQQFNMIKSVQSVRMYSSGEQVSVGEHYTIDELQAALFKVVQVEGGAVECSDVEQYVIGYCDQKVSLIQRMSNDTHNVRHHFINQFGLQVPDAEIAALKAVQQQIGLDDQRIQQSSYNNFSYQVLKTRQQTLIQQTILPFFISRLHHVRFKLLPLVCSTVAARLQLDQTHLGEDINSIERLWRFLKLGNKRVVAPSDLHDKYSGAVLCMVEILSSNSNNKNQLADLLDVLDQYDAWYAGKEWKAWVRGLRSLPSPLPFTKPYLHGMMDTAGNSTLKIDKNEDYPIDGVHIRYCITGERLQNLIDQLCDMFNMSVYVRKETTSDAAKHFMHVSHPQAVLGIVEYAVKGRGAYPFVRKDQFDTLRDMCTMFIEKEHRSRQGQQMIMDMHNSTKRRMGDVAG